MEDSWVEKDRRSISIDLSIDILDQIIKYLFTDSSLITRKSLSQIKSLFDIIDETPYETNEVILARFFFIKKVLDNTLNNGIRNPHLLFESTLGGRFNDEIENNIFSVLEEEEPLSKQEIKFINNFISDRLTYSYLFFYKNDIFEQFEKLETGNYDSLFSINHELKNTLENVMRNIRKAELENEYKELDFDLSEENFINSVTTIVNDLKKPSNYIQVGMKYFNRMLNGGFENGRHYTLLGLPKGYKSGFLLSLAYWVSKYNTHLQPKDPNKKLAVIYLSQENSQKETIERLFSIVVGEEDIRDYTPEEVIYKFKKKGLNLDGEGKINLIIKYRPNKSISTDDFYSMVEEIEEDGYEVIAFFHDYLKRVRSVNPNKDIRIELGNITDEETVFAKTLNIPFITAMQLNRVAMKIIENARLNDKTDIGKLLGGSDIGESALILENTDFAALFVQEYKKETDKHYLSIKKVVSRIKENDYNYFAHPFKDDSGFVLQDDVNMEKPISLLSLSDENEKKRNLKRYSPIDREEIEDFVEDNKKKKKEKLTVKKRNIDEDDYDDL